MSKYIKINDIRNALVELIKSGKLLGRDTTMNILKALADLPTIDIVLCKDCNRSDPNNEGDYDCKCHIPTFRVPKDGYCNFGEREDNE